MATIRIDGREYPLAETLRVAYRIQGQNNHTPYSEVFSNIKKMTIQDQIGILYDSFAVANPSETSTISKNAFLNAVLDNYKLAEVFELLSAVIEGITGETEEEKRKKQASDPRMEDQNQEDHFS